MICRCPSDGRRHNWKKSEGKKLMGWEKVENAPVNTSEIAVKMEGITVRFPGVLALDNVSMEVHKGEVHVLLGENGAGKSTLMKVLVGAYERSAGDIWFFGEKLDPQTPKDGLDAGIAIIYQELNLIPYLSISENIYLGRQKKLPTNGLIDWKSMNRSAAEILKTLGLNINPKTVVNRLGVAQQQMVEIAKALSISSKLIIMDEPTAALADEEIEELFAAIKRLTDQGISVIYISHRLDEIKQIGDRVTVLRDGCYVATVSAKETPLEEMIRLMVGRTLDEQFPKEVIEIKKEALRVEHISTQDKLDDCSFNVRRGEILGIAGLMGSGRTELMRALTGADRRTGGDIFVDGKKIEVRRFTDAVRNGVGYLSEDRKRDGLILGMDVQSNISLVCIEKIKNGLFISHKKENKAALRYVNQLRIKTPSLRQRVKFLSGGNQQKVVLAKWLFADCKILIFDEPTRGIDVGAKVEIYQLMVELAKSGVAIIMVTSEMTELLGMSDRIIVMCKGKIAGELDRKDAEQEKIMYLATGGR
jgi:ribose transport system ATP-binding protein